MNHDTYLKENNLGEKFGYKIFRTNPWGRVPYDTHKLKFQSEWMTYIGIGVAIGAILGFVGIFIKLILGGIAAGLFVIIGTWLFNKTWRHIKEKKMIFIDELALEVATIVTTTVVIISFHLIQVAISEYRLVEYVETRLSTGF